jgi:hypothetical protein
MAKTYARFLNRFSIETLAEAMTSIGRRGASFAPSGPELFAECERFLERQDPQSLRRYPALAALPEPKPDPAARERIIQGFNDLTAELMANKELPKMPERSFGGKFGESRRSFKFIPLDDIDPTSPLPKLSPHILSKLEREFTNPMSSVMLPK